MMLRKMVGEDEKLSSKSKVDFSRLPPCQAALQPYIERVNHRAVLYKRASEAIVETPKPYGRDRDAEKMMMGYLSPSGVQSLFH